MNSPRFVEATRWVSAASILAGIVIGYRAWLHVNPTTVALTLLLYILLLAARWNLRYAVAVSLAATACYNFYFLPRSARLPSPIPRTGWLYLRFSQPVSSAAGYLNRPATKRSKRGIVSGKWKCYSR